MTETSHPFVDWTDFPQPDGSVRSRVIEDIQIGDDVWHNRDPLTQAVIFSICLRPTRLSIAGHKAVGLIAENQDEEYYYYAVLEDVAVGETARIRVWLEGQYTSRAKAVFGREGYKSNFAWLSPHIQRIVFPKGYTVASVTPADGLVRQWHGQPAVVWRRSREFWGDVSIQFQ